MIEKSMSYLAVPKLWGKKIVSHLQIMRVLSFFILTWVLSVPLAHALNVGDQLKIDQLTTVEGKVLTQEQLSGKYLVVQIWATWCPYCHRQNANLKELVRRTEGGNLLVIGLSVDKKIDTVKKYVQKNEINFPIAMMTPELDRAIGKRRGVPEMYVIDPAGRVIQKDFGQMVDLDVFELARFNRR